MSWGPKASASQESSTSPPKLRSVSPLQRAVASVGRGAKTAAVVQAMQRSVSPLSRSSSAAMGRAVKAASAVSAIARSASPRSVLVAYLLN